MERFAVTIEDETVYVEADWGLLEIGTLEEIYELAGGETYTITYEDDYSRAVDWLDLDSEGSMTIDVRETIADMTYPETFVETLRTKTMDVPDGESHPERTAYFVDVMTDIWENKGDLTDREDDPFQ